MEHIIGCSQCGLRLKASSAMLGKTVRCPKCARPVVLRVQRPGVPQAVTSARTMASNKPINPGRMSPARIATGTAAVARRPRPRTAWRVGILLVVLALSTIGLLGGGWIALNLAAARNKVVAVAEVQTDRATVDQPAAATRSNATPATQPEVKTVPTPKAAPTAKLAPAPVEPAVPAPPVKKPEPPAGDPPAVPLARAEADAKGLAFFETKIRPVLVQHCYQCHSAEAEQAKRLQGGLRLDSREGLRKGGDSGPIFVAGNVKDSLLLQSLKHEGLKMPPKGKLSEEIIGDFTRWLEMGAPDPRTATTVVVAKPAPKEAGKDWAFRLLSVTEPPAAKAEGWARTPIDRFVLAKLDEKGLSPNAIASKEKLIRRATYDLWGLPPTPAELDAFLKDASPDAYSKLIDRLLASERYGERWGRHWLDVVRYAESGGYEFDKDRPNAFHFRNFVIQALNQDMPYHQFVRWQIAGDLLHPGDYQATAATGFLVAGPFPGQTTAKTNELTRYDHLDDMVSTLGNALLGLSLGCARCHDHKFDPISQEDYYRLTACFKVTDSVVAKLGPEQVPVFVAGEKPAGIAYANEGGQPAKVIDTVYLLVRGEPERKNGIAKPGFLKGLMRGAEREERWLRNFEADTHPRTALAHWITDTDQGAGSLLARVLVNRLWQRHLGRGLVETTNDFGAQGEPPTHPELLDWLAGQLIQGGWKLKPLHKQIMTSAVYMQAGESRQANVQADPLNRLWWRYPTRRLEAEAIRDALLAVGGTLDLTVHGAGVLDENQPRRSVYLTVKRSVPIPLLQLFDAPEPIQSSAGRQATTVPPQALAMMNSPFIRQRATQLAQRIRPQSVQLLPKAIEDAYRITLSRRPTAAERQRMQSFIVKQTDNYGKTPQALDAALVDFCHVVLCLDEFVYIE
jgi:mono/diheme cytochrome c family protein